MMQAPARIAQRPRSRSGLDHAALQRARWWLAADALDEHTITCGCSDDPCDQALRLAEDELTSWNQLEAIAS